jgi:hypothetical protein
MRLLFAPAWIAVLASSVPLSAQQQERKLLDRIQRPNMELTNPMQAKSFEGGGGVKMKSASIGKIPYDAGKTANPRSFSGTRSFLGIKNPWFGNRIFETKAAPLSGAANLNSSFTVRDAATGGFSASDKKAPVASSDLNLRPFLIRGNSAQGLDQISDKISKEMTIDDIREILNKPR